MSEMALVRAVLEALAARGVWAWRCNAGVTVLGSGKSKRVIRGSPSGSPDILGIQHLGGWGECGRGHLFGLECKTKTGRQSASQRAWQREAEKHGVRYAVVRSVSEALNAVKGWA